MVWKVFCFSDHMLGYTAIVPARLGLSNTCTSICAFSNTNSNTKMQGLKVQRVMGQPLGRGKIDERGAFRKVPRGLFLRVNTCGDAFVRGSLQPKEMSSETRIDSLDFTLSRLR